MDNELELKKLNEDYAASLPAKLAEIKFCWEQLTKSSEQPDYADLLLKVHSLVGAGATFGFASLSVVAAELESELRS